MQDQIVASHNVLVDMYILTHIHTYKSVKMSNSDQL